MLQSVKLSKSEVVCVVVNPTGKLIIALGRGVEQSAVDKTCGPVLFHLIEVLMVHNIGPLLKSGALLQKGDKWLQKSNSDFTLNCLQHWLQMELWTTVRCQCNLWHFLTLESLDLKPSHSLRMSCCARCAYNSHLFRISLLLHQWHMEGMWVEQALFFPVLKATLILCMWLQKSLQTAPLIQAQLVSACCFCRRWGVHLWKALEQLLGEVPPAAAPLSKTPLAGGANEVLLLISPFSCSSWWKSHAAAYPEHAWLYMETLFIEYNYVSITLTLSLAWVAYGIILPFYWGN